MEDSRAALDALSNVLNHLTHVHCFAITTDLALQQNRADRDEEIAKCLRFAVCRPLHDEIDALRQIGRLLGGRGGPFKVA
jgi:hypothetical protein